MDNIYNSPMSENGLTKNPIRQNIIFKLLRYLLIAFGALFLLIVILIILVSLFSPSYSEVDQDAKNLIDIIVPKISENNFEQLESYLDPSLFTADSRDTVLKVFKTYSKLGIYESHDPPERQNCKSHAGTNSYTRCNYTVNAKYSSFPATILIGIKKQNNESKIIQIKVNSELYLQ